MLRLDRRLWWAWALAGGCASIEGAQKEPVDDTPDPMVTMDAGQDAGGGNGDNNGNQNGNANATEDSGPGPVADAGGGNGVDAGNSGEPDSSMPPPPPPDGTCAAPYPVTLTNNKGSVTGTTAGKTETLNPKCSPAGGLFGGAGVAGPDQVYTFTMPFKGKATIVADGAGQFSASAYILTQCGNSATEKACDFAGTVTYTAAKDTPLFVYVDSGSTTPALGSAPPNSGGFGLSVSLRKESAATEACGPAFAEPYCASGSLCRTGMCVTGTASCGDTFVEGDEECDGAPGCTGCKLDATREACASAGALTLHPELDKLVARASGTTAGMVDDVDPSCAGGSGRDHIYSFTLAERSKVAIELDPGFDAVLALSGTCGSGSLACLDVTTNTDVETYSGTLNAGTYFVTVDAYSTGAGTYDLLITADPTP